MSNYLLILVWIGIVYAIGLFVNVQRTEYVCGERVKRYYPVWAFAIFLPVIIWSAFRGYIGDTGNYMFAFREMPATFSEIPQYMETVSKDKGFYFLSAVIRAIIGEKVELYLFLIALLQALLLIKVYRKYSPNYLISFFLFIASTDYVSWMFNGIRQFAAVTITFAAFELILNKKYVPAIIVILIASLFHQSALLVIPFIFIVQGKAWNKRTLMFMAAVILAVAFVGRFTNMLDATLEGTQYENVVSDWIEFNDDGTNVFRVLVYSIPAFLSLVGIRYTKKANDPVINLCTNMSIISAGFYLISMVTSGILIGRLPIYFSLYSYILLPWELEHMFTKRSGRLVYIVMIIAYFGFYFYSMNTWGIPLFN